MQVMNFIIRTEKIFRNKIFKLKYKIQQSLYIKVKYIFPNEI